MRKQKKQCGISRLSFAVRDLGYDRARLESDGIIFRAAYGFQFQNNKESRLLSFVLFRRGFNIASVSGKILTAVLTTS